MAVVSTVIEPQRSNQVFAILNADFDAIVSAYSLKGLIEVISRKTMLEGKIEDINAELEMYENEESRGTRRW